VTASNGPDPGYSAPPPNQYIPITSAENLSRPPRRPGGGCMITGVIAIIAFCVIGGVIAGVALAMFWFNPSPEPVTPAVQSESPTAIVLAPSATMTLGAMPTQGVAPTLTTVPTNTLPAAPPASPTLPPTAPPSLTLTPPAKPTWMPCPGAYFSRLYVGDTAYVGFDPPLPNRVRSQPNTASEILGMLQPGEKMEIIGGPVCSNQWIWWQVSSKATGLTGWTAEGDNKSYWLVPAP
jgi:hypothetical protein